MYCTGGFCSHLISSSKVSCCSDHQLNILLFLFRSYIGFSSFCSSGQNKHRKLITPDNLAVVGSFNLWITSFLILMGFMHAFFTNSIAFIFQLFFKQLTLLGEIFNPFFIKASANLPGCLYEISCLV